MNHALVRHLFAVVALSVVAPFGGAAVYGQIPVATGVQTSSTDVGTQALLARRVTIDVDGVSLRTAVEAIAQNAHVAVLYRFGAMDAVKARVSLHVNNAPLSVALDRLLMGTRMVAIAEDDAIIIKPVAHAYSMQQGVIRGVVRDAKNQQPIRGATVTLDGATKGVVTGQDGVYRVSADGGAHRVTVKLLGYRAVTRTVDVEENGTATVDVVLEASATALDQVVVTGTVIPTEVKAVPNAITVITAKDLEQRGITHVDQLFRGDVPGLFALNSGVAPINVSGSQASLDAVSMYSRGSTSINIGTNTSAIKTYVDGVEMADPKFLSQIDPRSIERIEILTGPQASTIYGSNAINGVMQIFTKRGSLAHTQLTTTLQSGVMQNNFSSALAPQHDYATLLSGTEGHISYNAGGSWNYIGKWTPAVQETRLSGFGGVRFQYGTITTDATYRSGITVNRTQTAGLQTFNIYQTNGTFVVNPAGAVASPFQRELDGQTFGLTFGYAPASWWTHELVLGTDASNTESRKTALGYQTRADTFLALSTSSNERTSVRYSTALRIPVTAQANLAVTAGADEWQSVSSTLSTSPTTLTGTLNGTPTVTRQPSHNAGAFMQAQLGVRDALFVTYGLRAEWNPNYGVDAQPNYTPRFGVAYTQNVGDLTAKVRASYGRSTRPPTVDQRVAKSATDPSFGAAYTSIIQYFGPFNEQVGNPLLGPEYQQGGEGGLELYFGNRASLVATRYNQTVDGLILPILNDSVPSLIPDPYQLCAVYGAPYCGINYQTVYQNVNAASIRNDGWELQGATNVGPFTMRGTYSWTKSRLIGVTAGYRGMRLYSNNYILTPGASFSSLPEHTWAYTITYAQAATTLALTVNGIGTLYRGLDAIIDETSSNMRLMVNRPRIGTPDTYQGIGPAYATADMNGSHRFTSAIDGVVQVLNLTNFYQNDYQTYYPTMGRQCKVGLRIRMQ